MGESYFCKDSNDYELSWRLLSKYYRGDHDIDNTLLKLAEARQYYINLYRSDARKIVLEFFGIFENLIFLIVLISDKILFES